MDYILNANIDKYSVKPINSYLSQTGEQIRNKFNDMLNGYELSYSKYYLDNYEFENGYKINLIVVVGKDEETPILKIALLDNYNIRLTQIILNTNVLQSGSEYKAELKYKNDTYIFNLKVSISTEIKQRDKEKFDTTIDYKNEYANVYFRVDAPYYQHSNNYNYTKEQHDEFYNEVYEIFNNLGWDVGDKKDYADSGCNYIHKGKQKLYMHPQSFSGDVLKNEIKIIHEALQNTKTFESSLTDVYEDLYDITDEEYKNILKSKYQYIEADILEAFKTKRSNLYTCNSWRVLENVFNKYKIKRLSYYSKNLGFSLLSEIFEKLVKEGMIRTAQTKNGTGYRTITAKELKTLKIA